MRWTFAGGCIGLDHHNKEWTPSLRLYTGMQWSSSHNQRTGYISLHFSEKDRDFLSSVLFCLHNLLGIAFIGTPLYKNTRRGRTYDNPWLWALALRHGTLSDWHKFDGNESEWTPPSTALFLQLFVDSAKILLCFPAKKLGLDEWKAREARTDGRCPTSRW